MRKVKALEILAAAIAVVPCTVFAGSDETVPSRPRPTDRPSQLNTIGLPGPGRFTLSRALNLNNGGPDDNGNFTWINTSGGTWQQATNWNPTGVPDGAAANAFLNEQTNGNIITIANNITLNSLNFGDPQIPLLAGPTSGAPVTINMTGAAAINVTDFASEDFPSTGKFFGVQIGAPAIAPDPARPVILGGSAGLTLNGPAITGPGGARKPGGIAVRNNNTYTGNTTLNANTLLTVLPGASLDGALGASGNLILNGGEFWAQIDNGTLNRQVILNAGGGTIWVGADSATTVQTFNGVISGGGPLVIDNTFGGDGVFNATNTNTGSVRFLGLGTNTLNGGFASASTVRNAGTLILNGAGNRLPDAGQLQMNGGALRLHNGVNETVGSTNLLTATPAIVGDSSASTFNGGALTRGAGTGLEARLNGLGSSSRITFTNAGGFQINGIIPWAYGSADDPFINGVESEGTELLSVAPNGSLIPRSQNGGYVENTFAGAGPTSNVRLRAGVNGQPGNNPTYTVPGSITINSLTLAPGFDEGFNGVGGTFVNGPAGTTITLTSGALLSSSSGFNGSAINSGVGNTINVNLAAPAGVEIVMNSPGAITMNGNISGSGGLTKTGVRTLFMNGTGSTYTGTTTLTGFNRHKGNLLSGQASAYGQSTSDILLTPFDRIQDDPGLGATGISFVSFGPDAAAGVTTMTRGLRIVAGGNGELLSSLFRNFSGSTFNMAGQLTVDAGADALFQGLNPGANPFNVTGNIVGAGHAGTTVAAGSTLELTLSGNNTFSGGFDHNGGNVVANSDTAFGTGLITVTASATAGVLNNLSSTTGARTIANPMLFSAGTLVMGGTNPFTFTGPVALGGTVLDMTANNTATFSGVLSEGGLFKRGAGTAVLSGNNNFHGTLSAGFDDGTGTIIDGGWIVLQSNTAAGSPVGQTQAIGASAVALRGGISIPAEPFVMGSPTDGPDGQGALRSLAGNNTWGGDVILVDLAASPGGPSRGSAGAAAGATLNIGGAVVGSGDTNTTFTFTKFGPGQVNVGASTFTATRSGGGSSSFLGSIVDVNHVVVNEGRLAMSPSSGANRHVSQVGSLTTNGSSQFDLTNNGLVVDYTGASPYNDIRAEIVSGYNGGAWNGPGIISSQANNSTHGVGYAEASVVLTFAGSPPDALFLGAVVDNTSVLARWTRYGDANLDGNVNLSDFNRLAAGFGTGTRWDQGDFDYNGIVNLADFNRLAANFGQQAAGVGSPTPQDWANLGAAVPEPGAISLIGVAGLGLLSRRRRQAR